jgi:hypothetical protein
MSPLFEIPFFIYFSTSSSELKKLFVFVISRSLLISIIVLEDSFLSTPKKKMCCKLHQILLNPTKGKGK